MVGVILRDIVRGVFTIMMALVGSELFRVGDVSVIDGFLEKTLFALLVHDETQLRANWALDGVDAPLPDILYRLGNILPRPMAQSMHL